MSFMSWLSGPSIGQKSSQIQKPTSYRKTAEELTIRDCVRAYVNASSGSQIEQQTIDKVKKLARSFDDWMEIIQGVSPMSSLGKIASEQLSATANTFEHWRQIYKLSASPVALEKMASMAHTREVQIELYELVPNGNPLRSSLLSVINANSNNLGQLVEIFNVAGHDLRGQIVENIRGLNLAPNEWINVLEDDNMPDEVKDVAFDKLGNDPEIAKIEFDGWKKILDKAEDGGKLERHAVTMVITKSPTDDPVAVEDLLRYDCINDDSELRNTVLDKLRAIPAEHFEAWKNLYEGAADDDEVREIAVDKMVESVNSVERLITVENTVAEEDASDSFNKKLEEKGKAVLTSIDDCLSILEKYYADHPLFIAAFEWRLGIATTTNECFCLLTSLIDDWQEEDGSTSSDLFDKTVEKLLSVATPTEILIMSRLGENNDDLDNLGREANTKLKE